MKKIVAGISLLTLLLMFVPAATAVAKKGGNGGRPTHGCAQAEENDGDVYDSTCDGSPSQNGNGGGNANGKPCAGCVGAADNKNPKGQMPNAEEDGNNGYECDGNRGVGQGNPAHSACEPYSGAAPRGNTKKIKAKNAGGFSFLQEQGPEGTSGQVALFALTAMAIMLTSFYLRRGVRRRAEASSSE